jgi:Skp family chaperone for outer membrane proteins
VCNDSRLSRREWRVRGASIKEDCMSRIVNLGLAAVLAAAPALAFAQTSTTVAEPLGGPQVAGVCILSQQTLFANAKVGIAANNRLRELTQQVDGELAGERDAIQAAAKALEANKANMKPADLQAKEMALQGRVQALQQKAQTRGREMDATRQKVQARIDRAAVLGGNLSGDLTAEVVKGLDAKIATITFQRETLPAGAGAR